MTSRKKRLKKGISSIEEQIKIHEKKKEEAEKEGMIERVVYYEKEIEGLEKQKKQKDEMMKS
tara:strand:- start:1723 stop:1908 length:186 start_codon:yes stop_codon:yes gene_type:complete